MTHHISSAVQGDLVDATVAAAIEPQNYALVRNLGHVLGITPTHNVLLLAADATLQQTLADTFGCTISLFDGDMQQVPFEQAQFDSVIVARPVRDALLPVARELARVTKGGGTLGMIVVNVHADYVDTVGSVAALPGALLRPAASYRAVLAESGWTAFVSTPRHGDLLRATRDTYRQYLLQPADVVSPAMQLLATDGVALTMITAENAL